MIDYVTVGMRIRYYRQRKGITQEQLAYTVNTSAAYISYIEHAKKKPSLEKIAQISKTLGVTIDELVLVSDEIPDQFNEIEILEGQPVKSGAYLKLVT